MQRGRSRSEDLCLNEKRRIGYDPHGRKIPDPKPLSSDGRDHALLIPISSQVSVHGSLMTADCFIWFNSMSSIFSRLLLCFKSVTLVSTQT